MAKGFIQKAGDFLGISKFGQGIATAGRVLTGEVGRDIETQNKNTEMVSKLTYAAKLEKDHAKKRELLLLGQRLAANSVSANEIDPGLNLSNREIIGSAANVGLNVLTPGAFKGGTVAVVAKNAALGAGYGTAQGLEKNRSATGVVGSAVAGAGIGAAIGSLAIGAKAMKEFFTEATPKWLMDKAIKPSLDESRKALKYGQKSLGEELLKEGVKGSPQKLLQVADDKLQALESELQEVLASHPSAKISREKLAPYLTDLMEAKAGTPGLQGDVERIKKIFVSLPEQMTLQEANVMKRRIYNELRDISYKLDAKLSTKGKALKLIAKGLKQEIETAVDDDIVQEINRKLSIYGRLEDRIVDQMARNMRNNSFGLTDAILASGGIATMNPLGVMAALGAAGVKHAAGSTAFRTNAAQGLSKLQNIGTGATSQVVKGVLKRGALNTP